MNWDKFCGTMKKKGVTFRCDKTFAQLTTLGCGGKIAVTLYPQNVGQLIFVAKYLRRHKVRHCFLGRGSNVLTSDGDYCGVAVVTTGVKEIFVENERVVADCGVSAPILAAILVKNGLSGGEFLGCLPATVGGVVVCNAGCFGQSAQGIVQSVVALKRGKLVRLSNKQCCFSARKSIFKNNADFVVLQVEMRLKKALPSQVQAQIARMRQKKAATQPLSERSAGCVLFNEKVAVSRLVDLAGLKGFTLGGAQVSKKHAGFVINLDKAASKDIYLLIRYVQNTLAEKFGTTTETEVCFINFNDEPSRGQQCPFHKK